MSNESETWSLDSSYNETVQIYGRIYQELALVEGISYVPVDEDERNRLVREHEVLQFVFDERHIFPPVGTPQRILDCGYGTGSWCVEVAERYPECEVIGVDISPQMRPEEIPPNLWLQVDDLNQSFTFQRNEFDFVHSRNVITGINKGRWSSYVRDCVRVLKPGGWLQCVEFYYNIQSDNGSLTDNHALRQYSSTFLRAMEGKKDLRAALRLEAMMRDAGLVEIGSRMIPLPLNGWSQNPRDREIGEMYFGPYKEAMGSHAQLLFERRLGMDAGEIHVLIARARQELADLRLKPYIGLYVSIGRKPNS